MHIRIGIELWLSKVEEQQMQIKKTNVGKAVQLQKDREAKAEWTWETQDMKPDPTEMVGHYKHEPRASKMRRAWQYSVADMSLQYQE